MAKLNIKMHFPCCFKHEVLRVLEAGFAEVAEAIRSFKPLPLPQPAQRGKIVVRYRVPADSPDIVYTLAGNSFQDSEGNPTGAADIDLSIEVSNPAALTVTLGPQAVSVDGNEVTAEVTIHVESPQVDAAVLGYKATNRDTGAVVAFDSDEFIVGPGEASVGTLDSPVPLTPEPEA